MKRRYIGILLALALVLSHMGLTAIAQILEVDGGVGPGQELQIDTFGDVTAADAGQGELTVDGEEPEGEGTDIETPPAPMHRGADGAIAYSTLSGGISASANNNSNLYVQENDTGADYTVTYQTVGLTSNITIDFGEALSDTITPTQNNGISVGSIATGQTTLAVNVSGITSAGNWSSNDLTVTMADGATQVSISFYANAILSTEITPDYGTVYFAVADVNDPNNIGKKFYNLYDYPNTYIDLTEPYALIFVPADGYRVNSQSATLTPSSGTDVTLGAGFSQVDFPNNWTWIRDGFTHPNSAIGAVPPLMTADEMSKCVMFYVNAGSTALQSTSYEFKLDGGTVTGIDESLFSAKHTGSATELQIKQDGLDVYVYDTDGSKTIEIEADATELPITAGSVTGITPSTGTVTDAGQIITVGVGVTSFKVTIDDLVHTFHIEGAMSASATLTNARVTGTDNIRNADLDDNSTSFDPTSVSFTYSPVGSVTTIEPVIFAVSLDNTPLTKDVHYTYSNGVITFTSTGANAVTLTRGSQLNFTVSYTAASVTAPDKPGGFTATRDDAGMVTFSWDAPSPADPTITGYVISYAKGSSTASKTELQLTIDAGDSGTTYDTSSWQPGDYYFFIQAVNSNGRSDYSVPDSVTVPTPTVLSAPDTFNADELGTDGVKLDWSGADSNATKHFIYHTVDNPNAPDATTTTGRVDVESTSATYTFNGLETGRHYFWIRAFDGNNYSAAKASDPVYIEISAPATNLGTLSGFKASYDEENDKIVLSWNPVVGADHYEIYESTNSSKPHAPTYDNVKDTSYEITQFDDGKTYTFWIRAVATVNGSKAYSSNTPYADVSIPSGIGELAVPNLSVKVDNGQITLTWNSITGATGYTIYRSSQQSGQYSELVKVGNQTNYTFTPDPGTYYFRIRATNATQSSNMSTPTPEVVISDGTVTIPAAPTDLYVTGTSRNSVSLSWNSVAGATSYNVYYGRNNYIGNFNSGNTALTWATVSGLSSNTTYYFYVTAVNSAGESGRSVTIDATTSRTSSDSGGSRVTGSYYSDYYSSYRYRDSSTSKTSVDVKTQGNGYQFYVDLPLLGFMEATVDGVKLTRGTDFTLKSGSTILTFTDSYINSLKSGKHTLRMEFVGAVATTEFTASGSSSSGSGSTPAPLPGGTATGSTGSTGSGGSFGNGNMNPSTGR